MGIFNKKNKIEETPDIIQDPLDLETESLRSEPEKSQITLPALKRKKHRDNHVIRVEDIQQALENSGDIDAAAVVSLYIPQRRARRFGAALLRLSKLQLLLLGLLLALAVLFIMSFTQEKMGNFTINLNRLEMYRKGISISDDAEFTSATARLVAGAVKDATNISIDDLPENLDDIDGNHNGRNYMAYTYYVRNAGKEDVSYAASVRLDSCAKGAENAVRVAVWRNGERVVYAEPAADGSPEEGCTSFLSRKLVCTYEEPEFLVGNVDRYTIVIWLEGDDPECIDDIVGGSVQFHMDIYASTEDNTSLFVKFVQDIIDTLTGDKPIYGSSDSDVPDYYKDHEVTWATRRNQ